MNDTVKGKQLQKHNIGFSIDAALYLDFYGGLLTVKQAEILNSYYYEDYSLSEIANGLGISRQAAHDAIRNGTLALAGYEAKLGLVEAHLRDLRRESEAREALSELQAIIDQIRNANSDRETPDRKTPDREAPKCENINRKAPMCENADSEEPICENSDREAPIRTGLVLDESEQRIKRLDAIAIRLEKCLTTKMANDWDGG